MHRRDLIKGGAAGLLAGMLSPARAAELPTVNWRIASSFPKSLDTIYGGAEVFAKRLDQITGGKFKIRVFAAGEIVPGLQVLDAVQNATVECGHTAGYYYVGKNMALAFDTATPFGMSARQQNAWMDVGGGRQLLNDVLKDYNTLMLPCGNTGTQMGGWFRKEIKRLSDLKGLKMRIPGLGGTVMAKLGAVPQTLAGGDIYPALEKGAIDATEWVGPYDDEKLGFYKIAKHYYYPGWWEGGVQLSLYVNTKKWAELPPAYQGAFECAAAEANAHMLAEYDSKNPPALARLVKEGVKLHPYPKEILDAAHKAAIAIYEEESAKNPAFKRIYTEWKRFRDNSNQWLKVAEKSFADYMYSVK
jgi:TRAP-type mannitol/chloroaromatic compound transport system substrate-binding protein